MRLTGKAGGTPPADSKKLTIKPECNKKSVEMERIVAHLIALPVEEFKALDKA